MVLVVENFKLKKKLLQTYKCGDMTTFNVLGLYGCMHIRLYLNAYFKILFNIKK